MKHLTLIFLIILSFTSICRSETHISGNVSGVWGPEGNPYIADSSVTVPAGQELQILPGVEMHFTAYQNFNVYGKLTAIGTETDSIYFLWTGCSDSTFEKIYLNNSDTCRFSYCVIDKPYQTFYANFGNIILNHSYLNGYHVSVLLDTDGSISNCHIGTIIHIDIFSHIDIIDNYFDCPMAVAGSDVSFSFHSYGDILNNQCANGIDTGDYYSGNIMHNKVRRLAVSCQIDSILVENNEIYSNGISGTGVVILTDCHRIIFKNNYLDELIIQTFNNSCVYYIDNNTINAGIHISEVSSHAVITNNLIVEGIVLDWGGSADFINNTIVLFETNIGLDAAPSSQIGSLGEVHNNIILGSDYGGVGTDGAGSGHIAYNCIYGFNSPMVNIQSENDNIFENPQLCGGNPFEYFLQANSPCIDAGDPASLLDPDSTRCDIGAFFYDQNLDNPPVISSETSDYATIGTEFVYTATATDDNGLASLMLTELPLWLTEQQIDWVSDTVIISGIVPENQEDFSFLITAEDAIGQIDTQQVQVVVTGYHILQGEISGILAVEDSPYLCVANLQVPEGDTLTIEPGVEIYFKYYENNIIKPGLYVYGLIQAEGTEEDSIYFLSELPEPGEFEWTGITLSNQETDTIRFSYCVINNAQYGIYYDSLNWVSIEQCQFELNYISLKIEYSSGEIVNNQFEQTFGISGYYSVQLSVKENVFLDIIDNDGIGVQHSNLIAANNYIDGGHIGINIDLDSNGEAWGNVIKDPFYGFWIANGSVANVYNNTILGTTILSTEGIACAGADSANIINNIITGFSYGIKFHSEENVNIAYNDVYENTVANYYNTPPLVGSFVGVNANGDSCDIYYNISLDPQFVGGEPYDYSLSESSPCIDAGTDVGFPYYGAAPDIGALESNYSGVGKNDLTAYRFELYQNYPNPFNQSTRINFTVVKDSRIKVLVYNILGEQVQVLQDGVLSSGNHSVIFQAESLSSGIYFIRMECPSENFTQLRKAVILK